MVARTVEHYIRSGVAGAHLEDQILTKRCGHLSGKKVVSQAEYLTRIRAAVAAKRRLRSDFVLIARTDALQPLGYDECIARLRAARDAGADVGLLEGFTSKAQAAQAVRDLAPWPLLLNSVENGASPVITAAISTYSSVQTASEPRMPTGMSFCGLRVSCAAVETASNPMYAKKMTPAPASTPLHPITPKVPVFSGRKGRQFAGST